MERMAVRLHFEAHYRLARKPVKIVFSKNLPLMPANVWQRQWKDKWENIPEYTRTHS